MTKPKRKFIARIPRRHYPAPISLADPWDKGATGPANGEANASVSKTEDAE